MMKQFTTSKMNTFKSTLLAIVSVVFSMLVCSNVYSQTSVRAFGLSYSKNLKGGTTLLGNTVMAVYSTGKNPAVQTTQMNETSNAANGQGGLGMSQYGNNSANMQFVDIDGVTATKNSSSADLILPTGTNTIKFARLYWGGRINTSVVTGAPDTLRKIKIRKGTTGNYSSLTTANTNVITKSDASGATTNGTIYESYIDITSFVNSNGAGTYTVADLPLTVGSSSGGQYGGWAIAVAYENLTLPYNSVRMYDGFAEVYNNGTTSSLDLTLTGLNIPSTALASDEAVMGSISWEGDADLGATTSNPAGDFIQVNGVTVSNAVNPATNFWNGTISKNGSFVSTKNPNYSNQMGIDIDEVNVGTGYNIQPNATSVNFKFGTEADQYFPSVFTFSVRVKDPTITLNKTVVDANNSGYIDANEQLTYTLSGTNQGVGSSYNTYIVDTLPTNVTYVPGSLQIISSPGSIAGVKTDVADTDQAFVGTNGSKTYVKFFLGIGATGSTGGELPIGSSGNFSVKFKAKASASPSMVTNTARIFGQSVVGDQFTNDATAIMDVNYETNNAETVTECDSYTWHGTTYTTSGNYTFSYLNTNNVPSVDTLHLTLNYGTHNSYTQSACETYTWHNIIYNASGDYTYSYTIPNGNGCESVDTLHLTINRGTHNSESQTACESYSWHGTVYTASGNYTYSYTNGSNCASVDTLHLTINYGTHNSASQTACESYSWHGTVYTASGNYTYSYTNGSSCASVDTLHLTVNYGTHNSVSQTACESYSWHGTVYTASGNYTYSYTNGSSCPSVDTLHLTVNYGTHNSETQTACESYSWNGSTYTASGDYTYSYSNADGCPSVDTLHLTVNYGTHNSVSQTACESYSWHGSTYTASGDYTYSYSNADGCPSVDTLHLTVNYGTHNSETQTACESFVWATDGQTYTASGDYTYSYSNADGCPSVDTLHLTISYGTHNVQNETACGSYIWSINGQMYTSSGDYTYSYTNGNGCASVDTLHLIVNDLPDVSSIPASITVFVGTTANLPVSTGLTWTIGDTSIISVSQVGIITALQVGSTTINITLTNPLTGCTNNTSVLVNVINHPPVAVRDRFALDSANQVFSANVYSNDTLGTAGGNTWSLIDNPSHGQLVFNADGTFIYTPDVNFQGSDTFHYQICDASNVCSSTLVILLIPGSAQPITLTTFNAKLLNPHTSLLEWKVTLEINAHHYEIERSEDGINFVKRGIKMALGNSGSEVNYQYTDDIETTSSIIYYRLKMIDNDGTFKYSNVVALRLNGIASNDEIKVYPNPFVSSFTIEMNSDVNQLSTIRILTTDGKLVYKQLTQLVKGKNTIQINNLDQLYRSAYLLEVQTSTRSFVQKIIKAVKN